MTKLYVGNLPFTATDEAVRALFSKHGTVEKVSLITDRDTGRPRGFGFVEMSNADASRAMQALNGTDFDGRPLKVNEAQDRERPGGGNRGGPRRYLNVGSIDTAPGRAVRPAAVFWSAFKSRSTCTGSGGSLGGALLNSTGNSMTEYEFTISLRIRHPSVEPRTITETLGIEPQHTWKAGDPRRGAAGETREGAYRGSYWRGRLVR